MAEITGRIHRLPDLHTYWTFLQNASRQKIQIKRRKTLSGQMSNQRETVSASITGKKIKLFVIGKNIKYIDSLPVTYESNSKDSMTVELWS